MSRRYFFHIASHLLNVLVFISLCSVAAACDRDPECGDPTPWAGFTHIVLSQSVDGSSDQTEWRGSFDHESNDILIRSDMRGSDDSTSGSIAMIGGRIMLSKGLDMKPGYEIDYIDAPVLSIKLLMIVLGRVFPGGPDEIAGHRDIDRTDKLGIKYASASASGYIPAPWHAKGTIDKMPDDTMSFKLSLAFPRNTRNGNGEEYTINMEGELGMLDHELFRNSDPVVGWRIYGVGPYRIERAGSTIFDYGATPDNSAHYKTIGDIRTFIAAENDPGFKDSSKDFTGFWKEKCDQPFGLQIKHLGDEGKYSIVFCGPGGCGDTSHGRVSFITGDRSFEVVSEDELIEISRSGERETYLRCTRNPNPVLKYE